MVGLNRVYHAWHNQSFYVSWGSVLAALLIVETDLGGIFLFVFEISWVLGGFLPSSWFYILIGNSFLSKSSLCDTYAWGQLKPSSPAAEDVVSHYSWRQLSLQGLKEKSHQDLAASDKQQAISDFPST